MVPVKTVVSLNPPHIKEGLWLKPSRKGFTAYLLNGGRWNPLKLVDDKGTSRIDDDILDTLVAATPILQSSPTESTTTYINEGQTVEFKVGQFAKVANSAVSSGYDMWQLFDLSTVSGETVAKWEKVENIYADSELVSIVCTTSVQGASVSGLVVNVYYNDASTPTTTLTTDSNGMASLRVPYLTKYKLVFPSVQGCEEIPPIVHVAAVSQRSVEVEYGEEGSEGEAVDVFVKQYSSVSTGVAASGITVNVKIGNTTTPYTTNSSGHATFTVPYGTEYTITVVTPEGYYIDSRSASVTRTAERSSYSLLRRMYPYQSGLFIMTTSGAEYSFDEWKVAVDAGSESNENAKFIKVASAILCENSGVFYVEIDALRDRSYLQKQWMTANNNLPELGNNTYSYNGLVATEKILEEAGTLSYTVPAAIEAYSKKYTIDGNILQGYLGGKGQMEQFWGVRESIDEILIYTRPNGSYLLSTFTSDKWTSTQSVAGNAWYWGTSANSTTNPYSAFVVPFFAFIS